MHQEPLIQDPVPPEPMLHELVLTWQRHAHKAAQAERAYRQAHCAAFLRSQHKTEALRKAEADLAAATLREARDMAAIEARAWEYMLPGGVKVEWR